MFDFSFNSTILLFIWTAAGIVCLIPMLLKETWKKYLIVPTVFFAVYASFITNKEFLGTPLYQLPEGEFVYLGHRITTENKKKYITLWAIVDNKERLYYFASNNQQQKELSKSRTRSSNGLVQLGKFKPKKPINNVEDTKFAELQTYDFPFQEKFPKNPVD